MHSNGTLPLDVPLDVPLDARCGYVLKCGQRWSPVERNGWDAVLRWWAVNISGFIIYIIII